MPLYFVYARVGGWVAYSLLTVALFVLGTQSANKIETAVGQKDPGIIVIDEVVGYLVTMAFLPQNWLFPIVGFFVFRAFDIWKPTPIRQLDANPHLKGFGIMIDDVLAGVYSNLVLQVFAFFLRNYP